MKRNSQTPKQTTLSMLFSLVVITSCGGGDDVSGRPSEPHDTAPGALTVVPGFAASVEHG
jgi:hypothetical protein